MNLLVGIQRTFRYEFRIEWRRSSIFARFLNQEGRQRFSPHSMNRYQAKNGKNPSTNSTIIETNRDSKNEESDETTQFSLDSF